MPSLPTTYPPVCDSSDGVICDEVSVEKTGRGGVNAGAIAAIVIVIIILICVIGKLCYVSVVDYLVIECNVCIIIILPLLCVYGDLLL